MTITEIVSKFTPVGRAPKGATQREQVLFLRVEMHFHELATDLQLDLEHSETLGDALISLYTIRQVCLELAAPPRPEPTPELPVKNIPKTILRKKNAKAKGNSKNA